MLYAGAEFLRALIVVVALVTLLAPRILRWLVEFLMTCSSLLLMSQSSAVSYLQTKRPEPVALQISDKQLTVFNNVDSRFRTHAHRFAFFGGVVELKKKEQWNQRQQLATLFELMLKKFLYQTQVNGTHRRFLAKVEHVYFRVYGRDSSVTLVTIQRVG